MIIYQASDASNLGLGTVPLLKEKDGQLKAVHRFKDFTSNRN